MTWPDLRGALREMWRYLTTEWLSLRLPRTAEDRQVLHPAWAALAERGFQQGPWDGTDVDLYREAVRSKGRQSEAHLFSYLARAIATRHHLGAATPECEEDAAAALIAQAKRYGEKKGETLDERVQRELRRIQKGATPLQRARERAPVPWTERLRTNVKATAVRAAEAASGSDKSDGH